jgi:hypothetical protein
MGRAAALFFKEAGVSANKAVGVKLTWETKKVRLSTLKSNPDNPRKVKNAGRRGLKDSLDRFGLAEIPAVDTDMTILAGNQRVDILMREGKKDEMIDVRVPSRKLTAEERREYNLLANLHVGEWDTKALLKYDPDLLTKIGFKGDTLVDKMIADQRDRESNFTLPDMELKGFESYDYIVLVFRNQMDWLKASTLFGLKKVNAGFSSKMKIGIGRVVDGAKALRVIGHGAGDIEQGKVEDAHVTEAVPEGGAGGSSKRGGKVPKRRTRS